MNAQDKSAEIKARKKRERVPLTRSRTLLEVRGKEEGFHYAFINEESVFAALEAGYEHVRHPVQVGTKRIDVSNLSMDSHVVINVGSGKRAFLMRQPNEFFQEDFAEEQKRADEQMQARLGQLNSDGLTGEINAYATVGKTGGERVG